MAVQAVQVSVGTTATVIAQVASTDSDGIGVAFTPPSAIYIGGSDVDTSTHGYLVAAGVEEQVDLKPGDTLYGIVGSGTVVVPVLRTGV